MRFTSLSLNAIRSSKAYEFEEKLIQKDTIGAIDKITEFQPTSEMESFHKTTKEIYSHSWLINKSSLSIDDSLALFSIAFQSPRVSGNAVYQARAMLGLIILDTETYATKSAQPNVKNPNTGLKIFPNPSNDYFNYYLPLNEGDQGTIVIRDVSGKEIQSWNADYTSNQGTLVIHSYARGVYFFELTINQNQKIVQKLIIK